MEIKWSEWVGGMKHLPEEASERLEAAHKENRTEETPRTKTRKEDNSRCQVDCRELFEEIISNNYHNRTMTQLLETKSEWRIRETTQKLES